MTGNYSTHDPELHVAYVEHTTRLGVLHTLLRFENAGPQPVRAVHVWAPDRERVLYVVPWEQAPDHHTLADRVFAIACCEQALRITYRDTCWYLRKNEAPCYIAHASRVFDQPHRYLAPTIGEVLAESERILTAHIEHAFQLFRNVRTFPLTSPTP